MCKEVTDFKKYAIIYPLCFDEKSELHCNAQELAKVVVSDIQSDN